MGDSLAISVRGLSKKYRLYGSTRERLKEALHPFRKQYHREFWALQDINFDVPAGQTLGIIGRNGSGKSTLLQVIASILQPTSGEVAVKGRVSMLLELGAGFNPQFTGRENVIFNAQLMGLSDREIRNRLPEIEAFADIGQFIDQPVKTYSSGMFVRLAFAAAINVDPDILLVDEALAVGDAKFQQKCYRKFTEFQHAGKTVVLVTHDTNAVARHCDEAILLANGRIVIREEPRVVINRYWEMLAAPRSLADLIESEDADGPAGQADPVSEAKGPDRPGTEPRPARPPALKVFLSERPVEDRACTRPGYNSNEQRYGNARSEIIDFLVVADGLFNPPVVACNSSVDLYMKVRFHQDIDEPIYGFKIKTVEGVVIYATNTRLLGQCVSPVRAGDMAVWKFTMPMNIAGGDCFIGLGADERVQDDEDIPLDRRYDLIHLRVEAGAHFDGLADLCCVSSEQVMSD